MKRFSVSVLAVILFLVIYVLCISAYTFISGMSSIDYFDKSTHPEYSALSRLRRAAAGENDTSKNNIEFNVCCDLDEYLNTDLQCVKANATKEDKIVVKSEAAVVDKYLIPSAIDPDRIVLKYNVKGLCPKDDMKVVTWLEGRTYSYYVSHENGYLLELNHDSKEVVSNYSTASFCLDAMTGPGNSRTYVALLCPCKEKACVPKCCPAGFYHNTLTSSCKQESEDGIKSYKPNSPDYHLVHNVPDCDGPDNMIVTGSKFTPVSILENGQLVTSADKRVTLDRKKYCVDTFSNGNRNLSYVSGFYCSNAVQMPILRTHSVHEIEYQSNTSNSVYLGSFVMVLCLLLCVL